MQKTTQATAKWIKLLEFIHKEKVRVKQRIKNKREGLKTLDLHDKP